MSLHTLPVIQYDKELFFAEESVTGRVVLSTQTDLSVFCYHVKFNGRTVITSDPDRSTHNVKEEHKKAEQMHVENSHELWKAEKGVNTLPAGNYSWPFSFSLPSECPSSFEGKYGFIRYSTKVVIQKTDNLEDENYMVESPISVSSLLNLNLIPGAREISNYQINKDRVGIKINAPTAVISGQKFIISGAVDNHHKNSKITSIQGTFHKVVVFRRETKRRDFDDSAYKQKKQDYEQQTKICRVPGGFSREFAFNFNVPPVVGTIRSSKFLSVEYFVRIMAKLDEAVDVKEDVKLLVGNVPFVSDGNTKEISTFTLMKEDARSDTCRFPFAPLFPYFGEMQDNQQQPPAEDGSELS